LVNWLLGPPAPHSSPSAAPTSSPSPNPTPEASPSTVESITAAPAKITPADRQRFQASVDKLIPNLERYLPALTEKAWTLIKTSVGGFLGITGFLLSLILVPIYLLFLLKERPRIEQRWREYLPLRASPFKDEVAEVLLQINRYIIAYFRGQLLVCMIDGILIGSALSLVGINFAPLIGLLVVVLTMIPYIGIILCWVPAVLIAAFQFGDWWHPFWVTVIFIVIQNVEGIFYAPRIVGKSVGLHPMTVIVSIFVWGLLIGGLLGPILAVPLTATIKVLLARYVWGRRLQRQVEDEVENVPTVREAKAAT
jgi:predicted PurR-regulated permease PerM